MNDTLNLITIAAALLLFVLIAALSIGPTVAEALTLPILR